MASTSETGHAKNVANFHDLIIRVESLGATYNPSKDTLKLPALRTQHGAALTGMTAVTNASPAYARAVDERQVAFAPLDKLLTRVLYLFKASVADPAQAETAASLVKKIHGTAAPKKAPAKTDDPAAPAPKTASTSRQSFDMQIAHFEELIQVLTLNTAYSPNEDELKVTNLTTLLNTLKEKTQAVTVAQTVLDAARTNRNNLLYSQANGLVDVAMGVKTYVKGALTPVSPQYKPILGLQFKTVK